MKAYFTHNITHELKTPIAVAYAANDAMLNFNGADDPDKRKNYLRIVESQLKQLGGLVEQILSMSMEQRRNFRLDYEDIELHPLVESLIRYHRLKADKPINIRLQMEKDIHLRADRTHLYNMVSNLIDNAVKYSDEEADIRITCRQTEDTTILQVIDRGIGIPLDKQNYLFDKFYRVPQGDHHDTKGYGLGLYYVKTMAGLHGGSIRVESTVGQGSTFTLEIPR